MAGITSTGLGSGININNLVTQLVQAEQAPIAARFDRQEAEIQAKISAYGNFKSALSAFRGSLSGLRNLGSFQKMSASSSDTGVLTATAGSNADAGKYKINVQQLAQSHGLASAGFADPNAVLGTGTLTIRFGATDYDADSDTYNGFSQNAGKGTLTLNIDSSNNTLVGIRDAINKADAGVTAAIVSTHDGTEHRLVLSSSDTGAKNSLQIAIEGDSDGNDTDASGLSVLAFNSATTHMSQTQAGQDAKLAVNGLQVTSAGNTASTVLKGVTLNLLEARPEKTIALTVGNDTSDIHKAVEDFVKAFNDLITTTNSLTNYDSENKKGALLQGDATLRGAVNMLRSRLGGFVAGLSGPVKGLSDIGISTEKDGSLSLDKDKLSGALSGSRAEVTALFAVFGRPSSGSVTYLGSTRETITGEYAVSITQPAAQGVLSGAPVGSLIVDANNDTFKVRVDGAASADIVLSHGTYASYEALAAEIQSRINGDSALKSAGKSVSVTYDSASNGFVFTSKTFGAASTVEITDIGVSSQATLGLSVGAGTAGQDVAGTIGGSAATGKGQELTSSEGEARGLKLFVESSVAGDLGKVDFSRGLIEKLEQTLSGLLAAKGSVNTRSDGLQKSLESIDEQRSTLGSRMAALEKRLFQRFNAMDALLGRFQATSTYLAQQLATLPFSGQNKTQ